MENAPSQQEQERYDNVLSRISALIVKHLEKNPLEVTPSARLGDDLNADELDMTELIMAIDEDFNIRIPDEDVANIKTVDDAVRVVITTLKNAQPAN